MSGKDMLVGAANESIQNEANTLMIFTGAPQNTRRKDVSEFNIAAGQKLLVEHKIAPTIIHAPYIVNLGNTIKPENLPFAKIFVADELVRAEALGATAISFHPGAHVGAGSEVAISQIVNSLDEILKDTPTKNVSIAIETMAGKGTEVGKTFEELASILDQSSFSDRLSITFDTCHVFDGGYDILGDLDGVLTQFDKLIGLDKISVIHLNDSINGLASHKDRHTNLGFGTIGFDKLCEIAYLPEFAKIPKIMETPWISNPDEPKKKYSPYKREIAELRAKKFDPELQNKVLADNLN